MENKYTIKVTKTKEDNTKYFVIQEYTCKDKLSKYEEKMTRYRKNLQRRAKKRALHDALYEWIEETINLPYEVVKTPNKTDCVFKWSETALAAKKLLNDMKTEQVVRTWGDLTHPEAAVTYRHPKLSDLTFKKQEPIVKMNKKEYRIFVNQEKAIKNMAIENREFSAFHKKLITKTYSTENQRFKQAAQTAAHESKIQKLMKSLREKKLSKYKYRLEFRKLKGTEPIVFITNYSNKKFEYLSDVMSRLAAKLVKKIDNFISINIYDNKTDKLLKVDTGWKADDIHYKNKLANMKALYPDYYNAA